MYDPFVFNPQPVKEAKPVVVDNSSELIKKISELANKIDDLEDKLDNKTPATPVITPPPPDTFVAGKVFQCNGCGSKWDKKSTAPVGYFAANQFGLYDTSGNLWEWTCSEYTDKYTGK